MTGNNKYAKRIDIVSLKMVKEGSVSYPARKIRTPADIRDIAMPFFDGLDREKMMAMYLNVKNEPTAIHTVSIGTLNASLVHPREVMKAAILSNAASIVLVHNHPSGDTTPSGEDIELTKRIQNVGKLLGIELMDHLVVSELGFCSLRQKGYM